MNNLMSFQDYIDKNLDGKMTLDSNRSNLDFSNFEFSPDKISKIKEFDASARLYKMLNQSQIEELFSEIQFVSTVEQMDIKNDIFFGTRRLIHNYLVGRSKYPQFKEEPVNMMIRDGEEILWNAINSYKVENGDFSSYVFNLFIKKTMDDLNIENIVEEKPTIKVPNSIYENIGNILSKLRGKSIILLKKPRFKSSDEYMKEGKVR